MEKKGKEKVSDPCLQLAVHLAVVCNRNADCSSGGLKQLKMDP